MQFIIKLSISILIIAFCTVIGKKFPSMAGLVAVMPLTGVIVLIWLFSENKGDSSLLVNYTRGAIFGIIPTILFYLTAYVCFVKKIPLTSTILISFGVWFAGAVVHQYLTR